MKYLPVLIPCGSKKSSKECMAFEMYTGSYFKSLLNYATKLSNNIYIVSGGYGLLSLNDVISPYDAKMTLAVSKELQTKPEMFFSEVLSLLPAAYLKSINCDKIVRMYPKGLRMGEIVKHCNYKGKYLNPLIDLSTLRPGSTKKLIVR